MAKPLARGPMIQHHYIVIQLRTNPNILEYLAPLLHIFTLFIFSNENVDSGIIITKCIQNF